MTRRAVSLTRGFLLLFCSSTLVLTQQNSGGKVDYTFEIEGALLLTNPIKGQPFPEVKLKGPLYSTNQKVGSGPSSHG